jgi:hypothetical protein
MQFEESCQMLRGAVQVQSYVSVDWVQFCRAVVLRCLENGRREQNSLKMYTSCLGNESTVMLCEREWVCGGVMEGNWWNIYSCWSFSVVTAEVQLN